MDFYNTGKNEGKLEGQQQRSIEIAKKMLEKYPLEEIQELTELSTEEISNLKESFNMTREEK